jgi:hypothetical protein
VKKYGGFQFKDNGELHYGYQDASVYKLNRLLLDMRQNKEIRQRFLQHPDELIAEYELTPEQGEAVRKMDQDTLNGVGAHALNNYVVIMHVKHDKRAAEQEKK